MIILQAGFSMVRTGDSGFLVYFAIGFAVVIAILLVGILVSRARRPRTAEEQKRYSRSVFRRTAKSMGLPDPHVDALENLVLTCKLKQPFLVFSSTALLDDVLRKGLYAIDIAREISEEQKEQRKTILFQIKQTLERGGRKAPALKSTTLLKPGQLLAITPEGGGQLSSKVVSNMKDFLTIAVPSAAAGVETRWARSTPLAVYLWRENDAGYSFQSKVLGYDTVKGISCVLVQHSKTLRREQRRKSKRREVMRACFYYPISIDEPDKARKGERKAMIEHSQRTLGTVVDLSAGGCAIQSLKPFEGGRLVMVEFEIEKRSPIRAFGKVLRVRRKKGGHGGVMHIMFTNVTRQYLNRICAFVYDFARPSTLAQAATQGRAQSSVPSGRIGTIMGGGAKSP